MRNLRGNAPLVALLIAWFALGIFYGVATPLFEAPDEVWHFEYARWIAEGKGLAAPEDVGVAPWDQEGSQPPLYYLMAATLIAPIDMSDAVQVIRYNPHAAVGEGDAFGNRNQMVHDATQAWPWRGTTLAAHLTRVLSLILGATTILSTWALTRRLLPWMPWAPLLAAAIVAFNPQFIFIHASTTNDALVTAVSSATLWLLVVLLAQAGPPSTAQLLALGALLAAGALSKLSGLLLIAPMLGVIVWLAWQQRSWRLLVRGVLIPLALVALLAAWWYLRNARLFGDPLALEVMFAVLPGRGEPATMAQVISLAPGVWRSLWGVFGWFNVPADFWLFLFYSTVVVVGGASALAAWLRSRRPAGAGLLLLLGWLGLVTLSLIRWAQISYPQGRLLFPALPALAFFVGWGWAALFQRLRLPRGGPVTLSALMGAVALMAPLLWIVPAYTAPPPATAASTRFAPLGVHFGDLIELAGVDLEPAPAVAGEPLGLTLYWQAQHGIDMDYSVFIHATDSAGILQAQRDTYPGFGNRPTSTWQPGTLYVDPHEIRLPETILAADTLTITAGLYDYATGQRLLAADGRDEAVLGVVRVEPAAQRPRIDFGGTLEMKDWSLNHATLRPGETLEATIVWEAQRNPERDLVIFAHLVRPPGEVWAQEDDQPEPRTSSWSTGDTVTVTHEMRLPENAPPGDYQVEVGVYDAETFERLKVDFSDAGVVIGRVRVE